MEGICSWSVLCSCEACFVTLLYYCGVCYTTYTGNSGSIISYKKMLFVLVVVVVFIVHIVTYVALDLSIVSCITAVYTYKVSDCNKLLGHNIFDLI